ncbi:MAG TPA: hypothetical protein DCG12_08650 [Planctomycetaceae bacterium]|nr:hypothetical protein [Planctomycetaceae bacterium]
MATDLPNSSEPLSRTTGVARELVAGLRTATDASKTAQHQQALCETQDFSAVKSALLCRFAPSPGNRQRFGPIDTESMGFCHRLVQRTGTSPTHLSQMLTLQNSQILIDS